MRILDLGCGLNKYKSDKDEVVGLDVFPLPTADVVHDIDSVPLPFTDNTFDVVVASHILEHVRDLNATMTEIHRILKPHGLLKITCPHGSNPSIAWGHPEHRREMWSSSFDFFNVDFIKWTYNTTAWFRKSVVRIHFTESPILSKLNPLVDFLVNINHAVYERFFSWIKCDAIYFELETVKDGGASQ